MLLHNIAVPTRTIAADGRQTYDMPVNPLSAILINCKPLNETSTLGNYRSYAQLIAAILLNVRLLFKGRSIVSATGDDLATLNLLRRNVMPRSAFGSDTDNTRRGAVLPLMFSRMFGDPSSCIPGSNKGDLVLELDFDVAATGYDDLQISIETIEIPDAKPKEYERFVMSGATTVAGVNDLQLPVGSLCRGLLLRSTDDLTPSTGNFGRIALRVDGQEHQLASSDPDCHMAVASLLGRQPPVADAHFHRVNAASASATEPVGAPIAIGSGYPDHVWLEFDATRDDRHSVDLRKSNLASLRCEPTTGGAVRYGLVEVVSA